MNEFLNSNEARYRLARTILQGCIGVLIANLDVLIGLTPISPALKPMIVALVMAILSPIMAAMGNNGVGDDELNSRGPGEDLSDEEWLYIEDEENEEDE